MTEAEKMRKLREACARACLRAADECPGTEDEAATWREAAMWCASEVRAIPLPVPNTRGCSVAFCEAHRDAEIVPGPFCPVCMGGAS